MSSTDYSSDVLGISPCTICPFECHALRDQGEVGRCGAGAQMIVARAALHHWEEPPISGNRGSGTVFFARCPLGCVYCQNAAISHDDIGTPVDERQLSRNFLDLQRQGALNINCVTPTHHTLRIREAILLAREQGLELPIVWNTSGYERVETIEALRGVVDVFLADFKYGDDALGQAYSHVGNYAEVALRAIAAMLESVGLPQFDEVDDMPRMKRGVVVRHLLLPGALENSKTALRMVFDAFGNDVLYSIMNQYTPVIATAAESGDEFAARELEKHLELGRRVSEDEYEQILDYADELGIEEYFWQQGAAAEESFIPSWDGVTVREE